MSEEFGISGKILYVGINSVNSPRRNSMGLHSATPFKDQNFILMTTTRAL